MRLVQGLGRMLRVFAHRRGSTALIRAARSPLVIMKLLQHDLEFGASLEHIQSLLRDLGELERCDVSLTD